MISGALIGSAFIAGILMFLAPCTLPIIPGYLLFISGTPAAAGGERRVIKRKRVLLNAVAFVCGFSLIFILLGLFAASIGSVLGSSRELISRLSGVVLIIFGLTMLGVVRLPFVSSERHIPIPRFLSIGKWESSLLIGMLFALGWSPCIGPILGTVLLVATTSATQVHGSVLLAVFSLGLGIPFILTSLLIDTATNQFIYLTKKAEVISRVSGVLLIGIGILVVLGDMGVVVSWCYRLFDALGYSKLYEYL